MEVSEDLINFDLIETQKENIQSLPQGRSAKALATAFRPSPFSPFGTTGSTRSLNDAIRADYEKELEVVDESDDPLDVYDRYVKWTLNAYPSAQATPESQLRPLLERATKAFQSATHYKNDPRYLKLWLSYIRFFSDAPRETFAYLSRHNIAEGLALFYEEFAAWLEQASHWTQAEEVYRLGIEREARPTERLLRKFGEFQKRFEQRPADSDGPSSPALPSVRPALAAKVDPFDSSSSRPLDPQSQRLPSQSAAARGKAKFAIFSDDGAPAPLSGSGDNVKGWEDHGTIADRRKENVMGAKPWVGETLKAGKKTTAGPKMMVYKDQSLSSHNHESTNGSGIYAHRSTTNAKTGRVEHVFVNLEAVYPNPDDISEEYCFDELRARHRGWLDKKWTPQKQRETKMRRSEDSTTTNIDSQMDMTLDVTTTDMTTCDITIGGTKKPRKDRAMRPRRKKVMEVKGETQTVKANLDSPTNRKVRRKNSGSEPTMTLHTKAANEEILDIFNQPLSNIGQLGTNNEDSGEEDEYDTDDYTSGGDSTTGRFSAAVSECGDGEEEEGDDATSAGDISLHSSIVADQDSTSDIKSVSPWSDFSKSKHMPKMPGVDNNTAHTSMTEDDNLQSLEVSNDMEHAEENTQPDSGTAESQPEGETSEELVTPVEGVISNSRSLFIPTPPEDVDVPTNPYRDPQQIMQSRLPFMTPIVEKTEYSIASVKQIGDYVAAKTPCRRMGDIDAQMPLIEGLLLGSPLKEHDEEFTEDTMSQFPSVQKQAQENRAEARNKSAEEAEKKTAIEESEAREESDANAQAEPPHQPIEQLASLSVHASPVIKETQCNPLDETIRAAILADAAPFLAAMSTYHDHRPTKFSKNSELRKFVKATSKTGKSGASDKAGASACPPPVLQFPEDEIEDYTIKRELGKGAFAPVYLASTTLKSEPSGDDSASATDPREGLVAIKAEDPPTAWEFYMMSLAHTRLGSSRAAQSLPRALGMHLFSDEGYLLETYHDQGTLLDLSNLSREEAHATGKPALVDEVVAMFFAVELLRTVEALHAAGILHGDIKADNCLVRLPSVDSPDASPASHQAWSPAYSAAGLRGWSTKGLTLIDFGRSTDMRAFAPGVKFIAEWKPDRHECPEMREGRPWSYQADYWGVAGVLHVLLFGKWIEDAVDAKPLDGQLADALRNKRRLREPLRRYWQTELWARVFDYLMNSGDAGAGGGAAAGDAATNCLRQARQEVENYLEENAERRALKASLKRIEDRIRDRKR